MLKNSSRFKTRPHLEKLFIASSPREVSSYYFTWFQNPGVVLKNCKSAFFSVVCYPSAKSTGQWRAGGLLGVCIKWGSQPSLPVRRSAVNAGSQGLSFLDLRQEAWTQLPLCAAFLPAQPCPVRLTCCWGLERIETEENPQPYQLSRTAHMGRFSVPSGQMGLGPCKRRVLVVPGSAKRHHHHGSGRGDRAQNPLWLQEPRCLMASGLRHEPADLSI